MNTTRRGLITGIGALLCAPAIVRVGSLMPVKANGDWGLYRLALNDPVEEFQVIHATNIFNCDARGWVALDHRFRQIQNYAG